MFSVPDAGQLQVTPVVADGIMYVTNVNECHALDAGTGRRIWHYRRPRTKGVSGGNAHRRVGRPGPGALGSAAARPPTATARRRDPRSPPAAATRPPAARPPRPSPLPTAVPPTTLP